MATTPWGSHWHLNAEMARILDQLARLLDVQRSRGRTPAGDAVQGYVVEQGEAEGLIAELAAHLDAAAASPTRQSDRAASPRDPRREIHDRARSGAAHGEFLPLLHAAAAFDLSDVEYDAFLLAIAVEHDARFGRLIAYLNDHAGRTRPTIGLACALGALTSSDAVPVLLRDRPLFRDGLLELDGDTPVPGLTMKMSSELLRRVYGRTLPESTAWRVDPPEPGILSRLVLDEDVRGTLTRWASARRQREKVPNLLFVGGEGSGRRTIARGVASEAGLPLVSVTFGGEDVEASLRLLRREVRWHRAIALVRIPESGVNIEWRHLWTELSDLTEPVLVAAPEALAGAVMAAADRTMVSIPVARADADTRARLWRALLPADAGLSDADLDEVAAKFRLTPRAISQVVRRAAAAQSVADGAARRLTRETLDAAARSVAADEMGTLAQKLPLPFERKDLIVAPEIGKELDLALAWLRHEKQVLDDWGFGGRVTLGRGLTALFAGPPGTGKTMAAQVLARGLGLDLYRVDLSRVMSKYIGDTEKAIGKLFDSASSAVLFFDEADALFGKRSEVKDAHDRYANVEIGYLLQRMEEHDGATVLATNRLRDMDEAFIRRFHVIVNFPMPSEPDRVRIWHGMLPEQSRRDADLDLAAIGREFELSGGEIKNAALAAAYLAAAERQPIGMRHLRAAIRREVVKAGRVVAEPQPT